MLKAGRPSKENAVRAVPNLSSMGKTEVRRVNFDLPADEFHQLKMYAAKHGMTIKEIFHRHVASLLSVRS